MPINNGNINLDTKNKYLKILDQEFYLGDLPLIGDHNLQNYSSAILGAYKNGISVEASIASLMNFKGVKRRLEFKGEYNNIKIFDDFAHHPTAIELTIQAIRQKYQGYEVTVLFQPHTFSRTITFLDDFAESLLGADNIYLCEIFASARETSGEVSIENLVQAVESKGKKVYRDLEFLKDKKEKHVVAVLGAGDIDKVYIPKVKEIFGR